MRLNGRRFDPIHFMLDRVRKTSSIFNGMSALSWKALLAERLPALGHRNWIGVVDSAYPLQIAPGIEMVATGASHLVVLKTVLDAVVRAPHVRPLVRLDAEMAALPEEEAPGIEALRKKMSPLLAEAPVTTLPHGEIIERLDAAARLFRVLLFKTTLTLPYTSVFIELDCGYWSEAAEHALRQSLSQKL
jgi:hypothetical protein